MMSRLKKIILMMMKKKVVSRLKKIIGNGNGNGKDMCSSYWGRLPSDVVRFITRQLSVPERVRLRAVCTAWSSALKGEGEDIGRGFPMPVIFSWQLSWAEKLLLKLNLSLFPWLSMNDSAGGRECDMRMYSHAEKRYYQLSLPRNYMYVGCCRDGGWLILISPTRHGNVLLFSTVTGANINLPSLAPLAQTEEYFIVNVVLSGSPTSSSSTNPAGAGFVAVCVYYVHIQEEHFQRLAFYKAAGGGGDETWTPLPPLSELQGVHDFDLVYHDNKFYIISRRGVFHAFDLNGPSPEVLVLELEDDEELEEFDGLFLLSTSNSGDLLLVKGRMPEDLDSWKYESFVIKKFDPAAMPGSSSSSSWVEIKSLGDQSLFLSPTNSMLLSSMDAPPWMKGNHIYILEEEYIMNWSFLDNIFIKWWLELETALYMEKRIASVTSYDVEEGVFAPLHEFKDNPMGCLGFWFLPSLS